MVEDLRYGRDPHEPLRPGEATGESDPTYNMLGLWTDSVAEDPEKITSDGFIKHFIEELRNQARGTTTNDPPPSPPKK